ncbi:hypothetical protein QE418_003381 [Microbacterium testaceum]|uniref:hypothetical protein n=1 Tax=Microbacterium TaxID=33882 RepID=UPI00277F3946|nr:MULTISPECIES: hypothetical protein [Microbacterium]MDQ1113933.1 hypothetical protein [Microbacterium testaceum]MDR6098960.1 hypothetical protein [Microbacterium sp. SORGH_AS_0454]
MTKLLNASKLFQTLLTRDGPPAAKVASDLDVGSFDDVPFITHSSQISQDRGPGLWTVILTINLFLEPRDAFDVADYVYSAVTEWGDDPDLGVVPGVGGVEDLEDMNAFVPVSGEVSMVNKIVVHYQGSFTLTVRAF